MENRKNTKENREKPSQDSELDFRKEVMLISFQELLTWRHKKHSASVEYYPAFPLRRKDKKHVIQNEDEKISSLKWFRNFIE